MKTVEELNLIKEEVETMHKKLAELNEEELAQVCGGSYGDYVFSVGDWVEFNGIFPFLSPSCLAGEKYAYQVLDVFIYAAHQTLKVQQFIWFPYGCLMEGIVFEQPADEFRHVDKPDWIP